MSKDVSNRIWRTVVFSGAMLGAPLVSADTPKDKPAQKPAPPQQAKPKPPPPTPLEIAQRDLADANKRVAIGITEVTNAKSQADRDAARAKLDAARKDKATAETKIAAIKNPPPTYADPAAVKKLEDQVAALDLKISAAVDAVVASQNDADRKAATAKLEALRKEKAPLQDNLNAERQKIAKPTPRPRTPDSDKPIGRGFILS